MKQKEDPFSVFCPFFCPFFLKDEFPHVYEELLYFKAVFLGSRVGRGALIAWRVRKRTPC